MKRRIWEIVQKEMRARWTEEKLGIMKNPREYMGIVWRIKAWM